MRGTTSRLAVAALLGVVTLSLCAPAQAQLVHRKPDGTVLINPLLCLTDYQVRQSIAAHGFSNISLNVPIEDHVQARATRGNTVYLIDFNRCTGSIEGVKRLRPLR